MNLGLTLSLGGRTGVSYDPAATALFARFTTPPTAARKALINTFIASLKTAGVWSKLDVLHVLAAADAQAASLNWKSTSFAASPVNSPTFTANRGYAGNGTTSYVDSGFNPATAGGNFTQNSAYFGFWSRTAGQQTTSTAGWFDGTDGITIQTRNGSNQGTARINQAAGLVSTAGTITDGSGLFGTARDTSTSMRLSRNGTSVATASTVSTALNSAALRYGSITAASFNTVEHAAGIAGGYLTPTEEAALYSALLAYLQGVGAA